MPMMPSELLVPDVRETSLSHIDAGEIRAVESRVDRTPLSLVRARSIDLHRHLECDGHKFPQVLALGLSLDLKPIRFSSSSQWWFGLSLAEGYHEHPQHLAGLLAHARNFVPLVADSFIGDWDRSLLQAGFSREQPTFFIVEGISTHCSRNELRVVFNKLRGLTLARESRLWLDYAPWFGDREFFEFPAFAPGTMPLEKPSTAGFENPAVLAPDAWSLAETTSAAATLGISDAIHKQYRFGVLQPI